MSLRSQQAGRDAADFYTDRHDPRFAHYRTVSTGPDLFADPEKDAAIAGALAQIERAFGLNSIERRRQATLAKASLTVNFGAAA